ncbi:MAG TPA: hypothetical protein VGJ04_10080 [Pirellulales bacterium]|jgi:hypothetical protein
MNYFAHGFRFLDNPYFLAGTAVPDWLSVANRKVRAHRTRALQFVNHANPHLAAVAQGIVQHHHDDAWFHNTDAFNRLSWQIATLCTQQLPSDEPHRPSFLGHILLELLLDAALIAQDPLRLQQYYAALETVDAQFIQAAVDTISGKPTVQLAWFIQKFRRTQFLRDYADDARLIYRLNQVMSRVRLPPLPDRFRDVLAPSRKMVATHMEQLIDPTTLRRMVG